MPPAPAASARLIRQHLIGPALGLALQQRGALVLHASGSSICQRAVLFIGPSGAGKSTAAAALCRASHRPITDDLATIAFTAVPGVHAALPEVALLPDAVEALAVPPSAIHRLDNGLPKLVWTLEPDEPRTAAPLARIYVLDRACSSDARIERMDRRDALLELSRHTYGGRLMSRSDRAAQLQQCASLVRAVPVRRLLRAGKASRIAAIADSVEADLADD